MEKNDKMDEHNSDIKVVNFLSGNKWKVLKAHYKVPGWHAATENSVYSFNECKLLIHGIDGKQNHFHFKAENEVIFLDNKQCYTLNKANEKQIILSNEIVDLTLISIGEG